MNKQDRKHVCADEKEEHQNCPHPNSDAIVDSAVKVPFVEPA